jgi:NADH:ubiquinone oxidoreductase subunit F (NADH-binding)
MNTQTDVRPAEVAVGPPNNGRLLAVAAPGYQAHLATYGPLPSTAGSQLVEQVRLSGLTGRGGAGFPTVVKLHAVAAAPGSAVVVANAAEGEPASTKDRQLLLAAPHVVLDGLQVAARITGAEKAFVYVRADAAQAVRAALAERVSSGVDRCSVTVVEAAAGFVSGQETAVVSRLNGGSALPQFARVRVTERGVGGHPTLVQNVETLGHLSLIARYGGAWFRAVGTPDAPGTFLATVHNAGIPAGPGSVWEVPHGLPLRRLLATTVVEPAAGLQAVLVGGYHGRWLRLPDALEVPLSAAGLAPFGGSLGAGVVIPLSAAECGLAATARIVRYLAAESAKQCGPCQFGLPYLAEVVSALAEASRTGADAGMTAIKATREAVGLVEGRGACHHPDGTARLVRSALDVFEDDVLLHGQGRCASPAGLHSAPALGGLR